MDGLADLRGGRDESTSGLGQVARADLRGGDSGRLLELPVVLLTNVFGHLRAPPYEGRQGPGRGDMTGLVGPALSWLVRRRRSGFHTRPTGRSPARVEP